MKAYVTALWVLLQFRTAFAFVPHSQSFATERNALLHRSVNNAQFGRPVESTRLAGLPSGIAVSQVLSTGSQVLSTGSQMLLASTETLISSPLFTFFMQTVISAVIPSIAVITVIFFAADKFMGDDDEDSGSRGGETAVSELYNDLYGDEKKSSFGFGKSKKSSVRNLGVPAKEFLKIRNLNQKFDSYDYSLTSATKSKAAAASSFRGKAFDRALQLGLEGNDVLPSYAKAQLLQSEKTFLEKGKRLVAELHALQSKLVRMKIDGELKSMGMDKLELDFEPYNDAGLSANETESNKFSLGKAVSKSQTLEQVSKVQRLLMQLELDFVAIVISTVGPERAIGVRAALLGDIATRGTGALLTQLEERPLSSFLQGLGSEKSQRKSVFVTEFPGDVSASQVANLREEVTAIVRSANPGDEVCLVLQSGGGTVTGYVSFLQYRFFSFFKLL
jgi:hypothetical protein